MSSEDWGAYGKKYLQSVSAIPAYYSSIVGRLLFEDLKADKPVVFLDVAAGPGTLVRSLVEQLETEQLHLPASSQFLVTDYADGMVQNANSFLSEKNLEQYGVVKVSCFQMDGCEPVLLDPSLKVTHLGCMFGIMFFPKRVQGLQRLRELMVPNGKAIFGTWHHADSLPFCRDFCLQLDPTEEEKVSFEAVADELPCRDPKELEEEFRVTGYQSIEIRQIERLFQLQPDEGLFNGVITNPAFLEKFPILKRYSREELLNRWRACLKPDHPFGQRWISEDDHEKISLRFIANIVITTA
eukprot:gene7663-8275_t